MFVGICKKHSCMLSYGWLYVFCGRVKMAHPYDYVIVCILITVYCCRCAKWVLSTSPLIIYHLNECVLSEIIYCNPCVFLRNVWALQSNPLTLWCCIENHYKCKVAQLWSKATMEHLELYIFLRHWWRCEIYGLAKTHICTFISTDTHMHTWRNGLYCF